MQAISKGIFVSLVQSGSPAALAGLRFGDQILQINGENVAGFSMDKVHNIFKKAGVNSIRVSVRDRYRVACLYYFEYNFSKLSILNPSGHSKEVSLYTKIASVT